MIGAVVLSIVLGLVAAQEKPVTATPTVQQTPAPQVPEDAKRTLQALQLRDAGLADAAALIQKERDAIAAEFNRTVARIQAAAPAGYELGPQLTYVKKPEKKEER